MITAHLHGAQERQWPRQAKTVLDAFQQPNNERSEALRQISLQASSASGRRKWLTLGRKTLGASQFHHVDSDDTDGSTRLAIDQVAANLAAFTDGEVLGLAFRCGLMTTLSTISKTGNNGIGFGHGLHAGNQGSGSGVHRKLSLCVAPNIGTQFRKMQEVFSA